MSRSYRYPMYTDGYRNEGRRKWIKRRFNKRVRRIPVDVDIPEYGYYRHLNPSWDICDFKFAPDLSDPESVARARRK